MRRVQWRRMLVGAALLLAMTGGVAAQEFRGTFRGQVVDTSGGALPGATVTVTNTETNETATATTNAEGSYTIPFLRPGTYTLTAELAGFNKYVRSGLVLQLGQNAAINVQLAVGGLTEEVSVTAETPLLETANANRGQVIDEKRIAELPLQARNPFSLSILVAGVNYNAQAVYLRPFDNGALADWSINGGQNRNNEFLLDGAPNNANQSGNNIAYVPPAAAVQEFKIQTNSYDAQYGRTAGGVVNVSLKSGTNKLHGEAYEYLRRKELDAAQFLTNSRNQARPDHYLDQYGFSVDGPVKIPGLYDGTNKTFFLFTAERYREGTPNPLFSSVPTPEMRSGDFSNYRDINGNLITIYDPRTGRQEGGTWVRDPFPGNKIPADRIHPIAKRILEYYPAPNNVDPTVPSWQRNLAWPDHYNRDVFWNWVTKVDQNFGSNNRIFVRWAENERNEIRNSNPIRSGPAQDGQLPLIRANRAVVADWVRTLGAGTVLNMRGSYTYYLELSRSDEAFGFDSSQLGFPASLVNQLPKKMFPRIEISDFMSLSRGQNENANYIWTIQPNISMMRGRHNIRSGLDFRRTHVDARTFGLGGMRLEFNRGFTQREFNRSDPLSGSGLASFLLGAPSAGVIENRVLPDFIWMYAAPWIQDDWRVSNKFTLNLGFRWDFNSPVSEDQNRLNYIFDPNITNPVTSRINAAQFPAYVPVKGGLTFVGVDGNPKTPWKWDKDNIQFRVGGAYQLNERTVLRSGYGRYYMNPTGQAWDQGFNLNTNLISSNDGGRTHIPDNLGNPFPSGVLQPPGSALGAETFLGRGLGYANPDFEIPNVDHFSAGIQRELPWQASIEISYAGSRTRQQQTSYGGINEPSLELYRQCDITRGGSRNICDQLLPNPFFGVAGFEGTGRYTSATISRFNLSRPFPAFDGITESERNDGKIWYDSLQIVANKRWARDLTLNATYTWVPRWTERAGYLDNVTRELNESPYFAHRKHRITASGVWEMPGRNMKGILGHLLGGWSLAPLFIFQSGQPWDLPGNVELVGDASMKVYPGNHQDNGRFIYGVKPCSAQRNNTTGQYELTAPAVAFGCTEPFFFIREPFQTRSAQFRDDRYRRPSFWDVSLNFAKTTRITDKMRFQLRVEAFNVFNSPMYDERQYNNNPTSEQFGRIDRNATQQSNFPRHLQLGFRFIF